MKKQRLGAEKRFTNVASYGGFTYIVYNECPQAALIEYGAFFMTLGGLAAIILLIFKIGTFNTIFGTIMIFIGNILLRQLAGSVNDNLVKRKISESAEFAKYFAAAYPEHAELCEILNEEFAINPDSIPDVDFHPNRAKAQKAANIIKCIGLGILVLLCIGCFVLVKWLEKYLEQ